MHAVLVGIDDIEISTIVFSNTQALTENFFVKASLFRVILFLDIHSGQQFLARLDVIRANDGDRGN